MANNSLIQIRIDETLKKDAELLFSDIGIDLPTAIRMFLKQAVNNDGIPFPIVRSVKHTDTDDEMIKASESSLSFWDNEKDDEVWNNV